MLFIAVQEEDFSVADEYQAMRDNNHSKDQKSGSINGDGAIVFFVGTVRDFTPSQNIPNTPTTSQGIVALVLEHYPAMTYCSLQKIAKQAQQRWHINHIRLIHRVGTIALNEQIVFVAVSSPHREEAFQATQFIMDYLKNQAPFWKKEVFENGEETWVKPHKKEENAFSRWSLDS